MIKRMSFFIAAFLPLLLAGQVTISVQLPPAGMIQKEQLWNLVLVNNNSEIPEAMVALDIQDAVTGQTVLSAGTRGFVLSKGLKMLSFRDLQPVQYNHIATELSGSYIPLGSYVACYRVYKNETKDAKPLADECVRLNISPLSPPLLNTPADKSVLQTAYPQFSWIPPAPAEMFSNLNYDLVIAEVLPGQTPADAILSNVPVYANGNIRNPFENYPSGFSSLQTGKTYAWQVTAKNGLNYSAQTEVWTFSLQAADSAKITPAASAYISIGTGDASTGVNVIRDKTLLVKYYSFYKEHDAEVRIFSPEGNLMQEIKQKFVYGDNFLVFRLNRFFREDKIYTLEISGPDQGKHSMRFSIKQATKSN